MTNQQAIFNEAKAFFQLFARSPWSMCHVQTDAVEIFASRNGDVADPMSSAAETAVLEVESAQLRAPHLGTLASVADIGVWIAIGEAYARLELLGEMIDLVAETEGVVSAHFHAPGTLVEYDQQIVCLS